MAYKTKAEFDEHKNSCKKCKRKGMPILLTRYAIAHEQSRAPKLNGEQFQVCIDSLEQTPPTKKMDGWSYVPRNGGDPEVRLPPKSSPTATIVGTIYTQRLLRTGFVYTYDPIRRGKQYIRDENGKVVGSKDVPAPWRAYVVNEKGYLIEFDPVYTSAKDMPKLTIASDDKNSKLDVPCDPWENEILARCISIEEPEKDRSIWICFSDSRWTVAMLDDREDKKVRNSFMREINVKKCWDNAMQKHACSIEHCDKHITEINLAKVKHNMREYKEWNACAEFFDFSHAPLSVPDMVYDMEGLAKETYGVKPSGEINLPEGISYPLNKHMDSIMSDYASKVHQGHHNQMNKSDIPSQFTSSPMDSIKRVGKRLYGEDNWNRLQMVALDDPAGLLMDMATYIDFHRAKATEIIDPIYHRSTTIAGVVECLRDGIHQQTKNELIRETNTYTFINHFSGVRRDIFVSPGGDPLLEAAKVFNPYMVPANREPDPKYKKANFEYSDSVKRRERATETLNNPAKLKEKMDDAWKKYENKLRVKPETVKQRYETAIQNYDQQHVVPLVEVFIEWYNSPIFINSMHYNHDPKDILSGISYSEIISLCIGTNQDKTAILEMIMKQLDDEAMDKANTVSRAMILNQDGLADEIKIAINESKSVDVESVTTEGEVETISQWKFWCKVIGRVEKAVKETLKTKPSVLNGIEKGRPAGILKAMQNTMAKLTIQFSAASIRLSTSAVVGATKLFPTWTIKLGCTGQLPILRVIIDDDIDKLSEYLAKKYANALPKGVSVDVSKVQKAFKEKLEQAKRAAIKKGAKPGNLQIPVYIVVNEDHIATQTGIRVKRGENLLSHKVFGDGTIKVIPENQKIKDRMTVSQYERVTSEKGIAYQTKHGTEIYSRPASANQDKVSEAISGKVSPAAGIIVGFLQIAVLISVGNNTIGYLGNFDSTEAKEANVIFIATVLSSVENFGKALEGYAAFNPDLAKREFLGHLFNKDKWFLKYGAKVFGIVGGVVMGFYDVYHLDKSLDNNQKGMAILYGLSALSSFGGAAALFFTTFICNPGTAAMLAAVSFGIAFVVLGIVITVAIAYFKDNDLEAWIGRSILGNYADDKFVSLESELLALEKMQG